MDDEYEKYCKELSRKIAFHNTKEILKNCLDVEKEEAEIEYINEEYNSHKIAYFLNKKIKKYIPRDININFEQRYQELRSYSKKEENKVVYDNTFFQLMMDFYLMIFDWACHDDDKNQEIYFDQLFYILNQSAVRHQLIGQDNVIDIIEGLNENLIEILCCLGMCSEIFIILHELAHLYLDHQVVSDHSLLQELEADKIAFYVLADLIHEQKSNKNLIYDCFEEYCIIAPIIIFEFLETLNKTSIYMYHRPYINNINMVLERKKHIFNLIEEKQLDNGDARNIYGYVGYIVDKYVVELKKRERLYVEKYIKENFIRISEIKENRREDGIDFITIYHGDDKLKGNFYTPLNMFRFRLKDFLMWVTETYLCNTLMGIDDPLKQGLYIFYSIVKLSNISLSDSECKMILTMHDNNLYEDDFIHSVSQEMFEQYMQSQLSIKYDLNMNIEDIRKIKEKLLKYKIFSLCSNRICLRRYIVYKK